MTAREAHLVELVDDAGAPIGTTTVALAHQAPGQLHRAFSVFLVDPLGRVLLQRRAAVKTRFAGRWANACCGHPTPAGPVEDSAVVRLGEELGLDPLPLETLGVYVYRAADEATGRIEHEYDHVLLGSVPAGTDFDPDPTEVAELRWVEPAELAADIRANPGSYAPWLAGAWGVMSGS